jgi:hypothetical protein
LSSPPASLPIASDEAEASWTIHTRINNKDKDPKERFFVKNGMIGFGYGWIYGFFLDAEAFDVVSVAYI